jgi:hypothetical protein
VRIAADGISPAAVTLALAQAQAPWPTVAYIEVCVFGLHDDRYLPVAGAGALTAAQALSVGRALLEFSRLAGAPAEVDG